MKRWFVLGLVLLVGLPLFAGGTTEAPAPTKAEPVVLRLGSPVAKENPFTVGCLKFAELVEQKTGGQVVVKVFDSGQLGAEKELIESVMQGTVDLIITSTAPLNAWIPEVMVFDLPYLFRDKQHFYKTLDSEVCKKLVIDPLEKLGVKAFSMWDSGDRNFFVSSKAIKNPIGKPDDFKGLKIRVMESPLYINQVKALGGHPVAMPFTEVYTSFQQGIIDGADNNVMNYYTAGFYEVAPYLSLTAHAYLPGFLGMNLKKFNSFSPEIQKALTEAALAASAFEREYFQKMTNDTLTMLERDKGVVVERHPDQKAFFEATKHLYTDFEAKVGGRAVIDSILNIK